MNTPWMLVVGSGLVGLLLPEFIIAFSKANHVPLGMNVVSSLAIMFIAASFV